jgi:hypothetical protein
VLNGRFRQTITRHEKLRKDPFVSPRGDDLHDFVCGRKGELQKERQELPDEQQKGMQLR